MRVPFSILTIGVVSVLLLDGMARAQTDPPRAASAPAARAVEISVSYGLNIVNTATDTNEQAAALEAGRSTLYKIASKECQLLMDTIAETCVLGRLNVQSNIQRHAPTQQAIHASANATYRVTLK